jgi:hypothetical protein
MRASVSSFYAIGFVQQLGVPEDIDDSASAATAAAVAIDVALLGLFASANLSASSYCASGRQLVPRPLATAH